MEIMQLNDLHVSHVLYELLHAHTHIHKLASKSGTRSIDDPIFAASYIVVAFRILDNGIIFRSWESSLLMLVVFDYPALLINACKF